MNIVVFDCILEYLKKSGLSESSAKQIIDNPRELVKIACKETNITFVKLEILIDLANKWYHDKDMSIFDYKL